MFMGCIMRKVMYGLTILGVGLGVTLFARERRTFSHASGSGGEASRQLVAEHDVILEVLDATQSEADHIRDGFPVNEKRVRDIVDFSRNFTDRCHHGKEERHYFPAAQVYAGPRLYGLVDELEVEHAYGRSIMDEIEYFLGGDAGDGAKPIAERLSVYVAVLRRHIQKETERLYQRAGTFLPAVEEQALMIGFDRIEADLGGGFHERYHHLAEEFSHSSLRR